MNKPMEQALFLSTVYGGMTRTAERQAVGNLITKIGVVSPLLDVMGVQIASSAAMLAFLVISFEYGITPPSILPSATLLWACAAGCGVFAWLRTVSLCEASGLEIFATELASLRRVGVGSVVARLRAINLPDTPPVKTLSATRTDSRSAFVAKEPFRLTGYKWREAFFACEFVFLLFRGVNTSFTQLSISCGRFAAIGAELCHTILLKRIPINLRRYCLGSIHSGDGDTGDYKRKSALWIVLPRQDNYSTFFLIERMATAFPHLEIKKL